MLLEFITNISLSARGGKEGKITLHEAVYICRALPSSFGGIMKQEAVVHRTFWEAEGGSATPSKATSHSLLESNTFSLLILL